jgi:hypothetical protein
MNESVGRQRISVNFWHQQCARAGMRRPILRMLAECTYSHHALFLPQPPDKQHGGRVGAHARCH